MLPTSGVNALSAYGFLILQGGHYHVIVGLINRQSSHGFFMHASPPQSKTNIK